MMATAKKVLVALLGGSVVLLGLVMIVLPGPAFIVIPAGIAILATEFHWARRLKEWLAQRFEQFREKRRQKKAAAKLLPAP